MSSTDTSSSGSDHAETMWTVWTSGPLGRYFLCQYALEFKGHSAQAAVCLALLQLDAEGPVPAEPPEQLAAASCQSFLRSSHGAAYRSLQRLTQATPHARHFTTPRLIARGGYGAVFLARHRTSGAAFALKRQSLSQLIAPEQQKRAWLEHRVLTTLRSRFLLDACFAFIDESESWLATRALRRAPTLSCTAPPLSDSHAPVGSAATAPPPPCARPRAAQATWAAATSRATCTSGTAASARARRASTLRACCWGWRRCTLCRPARPT